MKSLSNAFGRYCAVCVAAVLFFGAGLVFAQDADVTVQNLQATPFNGAAFLEWDEALDSNSMPAISYEVSYGESSVSEGLAAEYETVVDTGGATPSFVITGLSNGIRYYGAVKAVFASGEKSSLFSTEVLFTPSSVYANPPAGFYNAAPEEDTEAPIVESALALTQNLVKVTFSEDINLDIVLPELAFVITESLDSLTVVPVEKVEYKVDFAGEGEKEIIHEDIVFVTLMDPLKDEETQYVVTVGAAIADMSENPIESGVTDFALFSGTVATEIPVAERPLSTELGDALENPVVPPIAENSEDTTAPENVTAFAITSSARETDFELDMQWKKSISEDVSLQTIYKSEDLGQNWNGVEALLEKDVEQHTGYAQPETEPAYRITATDESGNENSGVIRSIRLPALPATGAPLALVAFGVFLSLWGGRRIQK